MDYYNKSLKLHEKYKGKLEIKARKEVKTKEDLSIQYTPGVAEPCKKISLDKEDAYKYTIKGNSVAVVSDGSAVLGLGNIGGVAGLPVMEGKAILFKEFANVDAYPICLNTQDVRTTIETVKNISAGFGGINLEDIKAPECFEIENSLQDIGIPVMHDDQHGTAVVVLAGLINALKVTGKGINSKIVVNGAGAAGIAIANLLIEYGLKNIVICDSKGIIYQDRENINKYKLEIINKSCASVKEGNLSDALEDADIFIGVSKANLVTKEMVKTMNEKSIIMAMANPEPEIMPNLAKDAGAKVVATGRSDFENQVNNVLAFPGIFRGALDARATRITTKMKLAAAKALAEYVTTPDEHNILPTPLDKNVAIKVSKAVKEAWEN